MKRKILSFVLLLAVFLLYGCGASKHLPPATTAKADSVRVEIRVEKVYVRDTVEIEIPRQTAERETRDTTSHLENDYATSDARINPDGSLFHNLETKPQKLGVPVDIPTERRDSIVYRDRYVEVEKYIEVERKPTFWERAQVWGFRIAFPLLIGLLVWVFRSPLKKFFARLLFS